MWVYLRTSCSSSFVRWLSVITAIANSFWKMNLKRQKWEIRISAKLLRKTSWARWWGRPRAATSASHWPRGRSRDCPRRRQSRSVRPCSLGRGKWSFSRRFRRGTCACLQKKLARFSSEQKKRLVLIITFYLRIGRLSRLLWWQLTTYLCDNKIAGELDGGGNLIQIVLCLAGNYRLICNIVIWLDFRVK